MSSHEYKLSASFLRLDRDLTLSKAWFSLSRTAPQVLLLFWNKARIGTDQKGRRFIRNNGELIVHYSEAERKHGITRPRFRRALKELIEKGFIDPVKEGFVWNEWQPSTYAISQRWRLWGTDMFRKIEVKKRPMNRNFKNNIPRVREAIERQERETLTLNQKKASNGDIT